MEYNIYITSMYNKVEENAVAVSNIIDEENNVQEFFAEGQNSSIALLKAFNASLNTIPENSSDKVDLIVHTDSSYIITCLYNMNKWFFKGMRKKDGSPVANPDLILDLIELTGKVTGEKEVLEYPADDPGVLKLKVRIVRLIKAGTVQYV